MKKVDLYTDGACSGNPGPGGWGAYLIYNDKKKELYGFELETTNNRMELTAAIKGLEAVTEICEINLYTDSKYVKDGITLWITQWKKNNWRKSDKSLVKNVDLWQNLENSLSKHKITWHWVKGHSDNVGNNIADALAGKGVIEAKNMRVK